MIPNYECDNQLSIFDLTMPEVHTDKPIRLIELFAGVGSQAMALRDIGAPFEHYRVVEFDKYAIASYNAIHGTDFKPTDIIKISGADLGIKDKDNYCYILTYSFPCQDLSVAGRQRGMKKGSGTRSGLLWEVERLLEESEELPDVMLMENVPQVIADANIKDFHKWQQFLSDKGYTNYTEILNSKDYGVAQNRERCFMVSVLGEFNYHFPKPIPLTKTMEDYLEDMVDEKYYINTEAAKKLIKNAVDNGKLDGCLGNINPSKKGINGNVHGGKGLAPAITTNKGEGRKICVDLIIVAMRGRNPNNPSDRTAGSPTEQRLEPNSQGICNTLTSVQKDNMVLEKQDEYGRYRIRKLTPLECWRLMSFTDEDFYKAESANSNSQLYKQAGNSIVKDVLMGIFSQLNIKGVKPWNEK